MINLFTPLSIQGSYGLPVLCSLLPHPILLFILAALTWYKPSAQHDLTKARHTQCCHGQFHRQEFITFYQVLMFTIMLLFDRFHAQENCNSYIRHKLSKHTAFCPQPHPQSCGHPQTMLWQTKLAIWASSIDHHTMVP